MDGEEGSSYLVDGLSQTVNIVAVTYKMIMRWLKISCFGKLWIQHTRPVHLFICHTYTYMYTHCIHTLTVITLVIQMLNICGC